MMAAAAVVVMAGGAAAFRYLIHDLSFRGKNLFACEKRTNYWDAPLQDFIAGLRDTNKYIACIQAKSYWSPEPGWAAENLTLVEF